MRKWSALTLERVIGSEVIILWIWGMPKVFSANWMELLSSADVLQLSKGHSADFQRLLEIKVHSWNCLFSMSFVLLNHVESVRPSPFEVCMITTRLDDSQLKVKGIVHIVHQRNQLVIIHPNPCAYLSCFHHYSSFKL